MDRLRALGGDRPVGCVSEVPSIRSRCIGSGTIHPQGSMRCCMHGRAGSRDLVRSTPEVMAGIVQAGSGGLVSEREGDGVSIWKRWEGEVGEASGE